VFVFVAFVIFVYCDYLRYLLFKSVFPLRLCVTFLRLCDLSVLCESEFSDVSLKHNRFDEPLAKRLRLAVF